MGSVNSTSSGLSNLLQTLSTEMPQLSSVLSTPKVKSALQNASPTDTVILSDLAVQLQQVGLLFGNSDGTQPAGPTSVLDSLFPALSPQGSNDPTSLIYQSLASSLTAGADGQSASTLAPSSLADQIANTAGNLQAQEMNALFGTVPTVDSALNTLA
jgi:hypothetical protein